LTAEVPRSMDRMHGLPAVGTVSFPLFAHGTEATAGPIYEARSPGQGSW
jgi:hypothetical protein